MIFIINIYRLTITDVESNQTNSEKYIRYMARFHQIARICHKWRKLSHFCEGTRILCFLAKELEWWKQKCYKNVFIWEQKHLEEHIFEGNIHEFHHLLLSQTHFVLIQNRQSSNFWHHILSNLSYFHFFGLFSSFISQFKNKERAKIMVHSTIESKLSTNSPGKSSPGVQSEN